MARQSRRFLYENFLMSVCGHLFLVALVITSVAIVLNRAQLVASDRIQIMEIDLDSVKITGDETKLYNTSADVLESKDVSDKPSDEEVTQDVPKTVPDVTPVAEVPLETPSMIEDTPVPVPEKTKDTSVNKDKKSRPIEKVPFTPRKKTVVRVNREVVSTDRTLTVSVVDALRVAMTRCWAIDTSRPGVSDIRAVAHMTLNRNGTVRDLWFESASRAETDADFAYVLETIRHAIDTCQPFRMLPLGEYKKWEKIQLTFYPNNGQVM